MTSTTTETSTPPAVNEKVSGSGFTKEAFMAEGFHPKHLNLIVQEGIILGGGIAAILLQVADPGVAAGVNEHSNFTYRVLDRLRTTMTYVYVLSYGTPQEKKIIVDQVTKIHSAIGGTLAEGRDKGKPYHALDPELQMWVAATLYVTGTEMHRRIFGEIKDPEIIETIYQEYAVVACALQVPPEMWPATRADFWVYWNKKLAETEITQHAREVGDDLVTLRHAPLWMRLFLPSVRIFTAELLDPRMRREFNLKRHPKSYKVLEIMVKAAYRPLPLAIRSLPAKYFMKDMRKRMKHHQKIFDKAGYTVPYDSLDEKGSVREYEYVR